MMKNVIFKINNICLYEDQILLDYIYPVLFTCIDDFDNMYLSVCYDAEASKTCWLLAKVSPDQVISLLENRVTIRELFECKDLWYICKYANSSEKYVEKVKDYKNFDQDAFPAKGEYMDAEEDEFLEEIELFRNRISSESYKVKQEKFFKYSFSRINIDLDGMQALKNMTTYTFREDNQKKQLWALNIIPVCYELKDTKYNNDMNNMFYCEKNDIVKEYNNVYIS